MIRGAQRNMIVVKTPESKIFEEAHFFVRRDVNSDSFDLICEANKIVEGCVPGYSRRKVKNNTKYYMWALIFASGFILGAFIMLLAVYFF